MKKTRKKLHKKCFVKEQQLPKRKRLISKLANRNNLLLGLRIIEVLGNLPEIAFKIIDWLESLLKFYKSI